ncbi:MULTISPECIES: hypothetical protein [Bosea]|jgi:hypothetical protein|uniref:hypothetical protein n=1 Tax=Bosea TaxID=85413 RepID=UPI00214F66E6|nr:MULTISPECIES: hypothetical protein [Bosea]MCR4521125.1 hypothetical protein [Bosea sp. 47.2.35]MDR6831283.1 hypothetical protein [Bosea robiniae]MDR6897991.1 hypothetical protein [Bosea sp. BE109]MDR7141388.1 hypothetical protein [Bosea sp. BE168]MDR7178050.1 hypothetical protein [Bosea sp. BE271]
MSRFVAIAALAAALSSPALAEPGFVKTASLPVLGSAYMISPRAACELPISLLVPAEPVASTPERAMTLSPRMVQAIRIDNKASID